MLWNLHEETNLANFPIQKKKKMCQPTAKQYQNKQDKAFGTFLNLKLIVTKAAGPKAVY